MIFTSSINSINVRIVSIEPFFLIKCIDCYMPLSIVTLRNVDYEYLETHSLMLCTRGIHRALFLPCPALQDRTGQGKPVLQYLYSIERSKEYDRLNHFFVKLILKTSLYPLIRIINRH